MDKIETKNPSKEFTSQSIGESKAGVAYDNNKMVVSNHDAKLL